MSGMRFKFGSPTALEVDGGMLVLSTGSNTIVIIYQPPSIGTPSGWDSTKIYYSKTSTAWPSSGSVTLAVSAGPPTSTPSTFSSTTLARFANQTSAPSASSTLFMPSGGAWGIDLSALTGTSSSTSGSAIWWNSSGSDISIPVGITLTSNVTPSSATTYKDTDTLGG